MPTENERVAVVEERVDRHSDIIQRIDETMVQLRVYTESSQRLLESHEKGIQDLQLRELERNKQTDDRFEIMLDKFHDFEIRHEKQRAEDRKIVTDATNKVTSDNDKRIRDLESWKWKALGFLSALSLLGPYAIKLLSS